MSKIVAFVHLSLDGVMQAPGRPGEDTRGGFAHGGWGAAYSDEVMMKAVGESMGNTGSILLGRRTYEDFYQVWPKRTDNPFTPVLNNTLKFVASRTATEPLPWMNSQLLKGNAEEQVAELRRHPGKDIIVLGSGMLLQSLLRCRLVDELMLTINPLLLGGGQRLFPSDGRLATLRLLDSRTTTKGVVITRYQPTELAEKAA